MGQTRIGHFRAVLFDLDGTLVDTAPDMVAVLQDLQRDHGQAAISYDVARMRVSNGALGLIRIAFPDADEEQRSDLHQQYLQRYTANVCRRSAVFPGLEALLDRLDAASRPWGIVTNKPARMTDPLLNKLGLAHRCACIVSGDTLKQRKPHPAPLLHACDLAGFDPKSTVYVGDAERDVEAGRRAGMATIAVSYGYVMADDDPESWGADRIAADTTELLQMILEGVNLEP
ncbi:MAG: phosphoglycolate phosphatase [Proteobacteria bacterium]|nr:phosphoglycolate phosphatase [Pseudomonadota bacterium]